MFRLSRVLPAIAIFWLFATTASADVLQYISITDSRFPSNNPPSATWTLSDDYGGTPLNAWITYTGDDTRSDLSPALVPRAG